jgi:hypothetical protein
VAQVAVVVQVFIAQGQAIDTLLEQFKQRVITAGLAAGISDSPGNGPNQTHLLVNLGDEPDTTIAGDVTAAKIGFNFAAFNGWKFERSLVAFCHGGIFLLTGFDTLIFKIFPPFFYPLREIFRLVAKEDGIYTSNVFKWC